jgi:hypothetical protein
MKRFFVTMSVNIFKMVSTFRSARIHVSAQSRIIAGSIITSDRHGDVYSCTYRRNEIRSLLKPKRHKSAVRRRDDHMSGLYTEYSNNKKINSTTKLVPLRPLFYLLTSVFLMFRLHNVGRFINNELGKNVNATCFKVGQLHYQCLEQLRKITKTLSTQPVSVQNF